MRRIQHSGNWTALPGVAVLMSAPLAARVSVGTAYSLDGERVLYQERRTVFDYSPAAGGEAGILGAG